MEPVGASTGNVVAFPATPAQAWSQDAQLKAWADELGAINERLTPAKIRIKKDEERQKILEEYLKAKAKTLAADMPEIVEGSSFGCKFSAARQSTKIKSMKAAMVAVRAGGICRVIDVFETTLEKLKKAVPEDEFAKLTTTERTGIRTLETYRLVDPEQAA
jgi:CHAD domain-containing protein